MLPPIPLNLLSTCLVFGPPRSIFLDPGTCLLTYPSSQPSACSQLCFLLVSLSLSLALHNYSVFTTKGLSCLDLWVILLIHSFIHPEVSTGLCALQKAVGSVSSVGGDDTEQGAPGAFCLSCVHDHMMAIMSYQFFSFLLKAFLPEKHSSHT